MPRVHLVLREKDVSKLSPQQAGQRQLLALVLFFFFLIDDHEGNPSPTWV